MDNGWIIYKRLLNYSKTYWRVFLLGILGTIIGSGVDASFAWLIRPILDKGFIHKEAGFIHWLPGILILAMLCRNGGNFMSNYYMSWAGRSVIVQFRKDLFKHYMGLPANYLDNTAPGQLLSRLIYNVEQVAKASTNAILTVFQESFFIAGLIFVMFINSWQLSLIFMAIIPIIAWIAKKSSKKMRNLSSHVQDAISQVSQITEESLAGYREIRTFGAQAYEIERFNAAAHKNREKEMKTIAIDSFAGSAVQLVIAVLMSGTVYIATAKFTHITAGAFVSIITAMLSMLKPLRNLSTVNSTIQKGIAGAENLFQLLDEPLEIDQGKSIFHRPAAGHIVFNQVNFSYPHHQKTVLKNINFDIPAGKTIALVGKSGSGKSTLVSLLPRFYDNYSGDIFLDSKNIRQLSLKSLRDQIALVSQQVILFNDTIANNIAYGQAEKISEAQIIAAAKSAHAWEFIEELPAGLHSWIGGNGVLLSGGQRQRLAIARALLKNAPVLILDEATSALDTESERYIQSALEKLIENRTTLVIAHRLSTIEKADSILVIDNGRIIESGSHTELMRLENGHYASLHHQHIQHDQHNSK